MEQQRCAGRRLKGGARTERGTGNVGKGRVYGDRLHQLLHFAPEDIEVQRSKPAHPRPQHALVVELGGEPWLNLPRAKSGTIQPGYFEPKTLFGSLRHSCVPSKSGKPVITHWNENWRVEIFFKSLCLCFPVSKSRVWAVLKIEK